MTLTESTYLKQIELACDPESGALVHVFAERVNIVARDGAVIAQSAHRDSFDADSEAGRAILGEALAIATAGTQKAVVERDAAAASLAELEDAHRKLQEHSDAVGRQLAALVEMHEQALAKIKELEQQGAPQ